MHGTGTARLAAEASLVAKPVALVTKRVVVVCVWEQPPQQHAVQDARVDEKLLACEDRVGGELCSGPFPPAVANRLLLRALTAPIYIYIVTYD